MGKGDAIIFLSLVEKLVRIRTGERSMKVCNIEERSAGDRPAKEKTAT